MLRILHSTQIHSTALFSLHFHYIQEQNFTSTTNLVDVFEVLIKKTEKNMEREMYTNERINNQSCSGFYTFHTKAGD